jgi:hypothetical protein
LLTASDGLALLNRACDFRSDLVGIAAMFFETGNRRVPKASHLYFEAPECAPLRVMSLNGSDGRKAKMPFLTHV